jgi:hypothetical protein
MKKSQWQFTHRPDNQADIKRILREAREGGLTLVEVRGGPEHYRGVYLDARFIQEHKQHWPKDVALFAANTWLDGWGGNWAGYAGDAKRAHEQFCKNLEAASQRREYPPTVSVRAAGPDLAPIVAAPAERYIPKVGDRFTAKGRPGVGALLRTVHRPHQDVYECLNASNLYLTAALTPHQSYEMTKGCYEFRKVEAQPEKPYIPQPGDWFSAKAIDHRCLGAIRHNPHGQTLMCVGETWNGCGLQIEFFGGVPSGIWSITKAYYEFRKREKL